MASPNKCVQFQLSADLFPIIYKDIESGIYVAEVIAPPPGEASRYAQVLMDSNTLEAIQATDLRLVQRMAYWAQPGTVMTLNPGFAFSEQLLSNSHNAEAKMKDWTTQLSPSGIFPKEFSSTFYQYIKEREYIIREQISIVFCYLALFEHWSTELRMKDDTLEKWINFFQEDIPRLKILYFLGGLFAISTRDESLRLRGANDSVASWRQAVCSTRIKEKADYARHLRNRAFDILYFMLAPVLTLSSSGGYASRVLLTTKDRFIGEFLCRIFQWIHVQENTQWLLRMCSEQFVSKLGNASLDAIQLLIERNPQAREYKDIPGERDAKLKHLAELTIKMLPPDHALELRCALEAFAHPL